MYRQYNVTSVKPGKLSFRQACHFIGSLQAWQLCN